MSTHPSILRLISSRKQKQQYWLLRKVLIRTSYVITTSLKWLTHTYTCEARSENTLKSKKEKERKSTISEMKKKINVSLTDKITTSSYPWPFFSPRTYTQHTCMFGVIYTRCTKQDHIQRWNELHHMYTIFCCTIMWRDPLFFYEVGWPFIIIMIQWQNTYKTRFLAKRKKTKTV